MKKRIFVLVILLLFLCGCGKKEATETIFAMDTVMDLTVYGRNAEENAELAAETILQLETELSVTREDSAASRINAGETVTLSEDVRLLLEKTLTLSEETGGALDPTIYPLVKLWGFTTGEYRVPSETEIAETLRQIENGSLILEENMVTADGAEVDFGAVAKGYAGYAAAQVLKDAGVESALLQLGGNIQAVGTKTDGSPWRVGIQNPWGEGYIGVVEVSDAAVVTSGGYQRYFEQDGETYIHILDPKTGYPADTGLASVTIVTVDGFLADGLSTALFVMGLEDAAAFWQSREDFEAVLVDTAGRIYVTEGLIGSFECENFSVIER